MTDFSADDRRLLSGGYRARLLIVLLIASTLSFTDRQAFTATFQVIKQDLKFSDFQLGLLAGLGFALVYALAAIPIARIAEHRSRVVIIALAIVGWSIMTGLTGVAAGFATMLICRAGVGIGEAGGSAPATSLISDHFPLPRRASANSIFLLGSPFGALVGGVLGGWVAQHYGWRNAFFALAAPGVFVALLVVLTLREPPRGLADGRKPPATPPPSLRTAFQFLITKPTFCWLVIAASLAAVGMTSVSQFMAPYLARSYHLNVQSTGQFFGMISAASLTCGMLVGGFGGDRLALRDRRWHAWAPAIGVFLACPMYVTAFLQTSLWPTTFFLFMGGFTLFFYYAPVVAAVQNMATPRMRASAAALFGLVFSTAGPGMGPVIMGLMSDGYAHHIFKAGDFGQVCRGGLAAKGAAAGVAHACASASAMGLKDAFLTVVSVFALSGVFFLVASRTLRADVYDPASETPAHPLFEESVDGLPTT
jgi:predicted MFS family arabinose efflux permease